MASDQESAECAAEKSEERMPKQNLIDRYIAEVGRMLPEKQRNDVQLELRSALQDALDERGLIADTEADEAKVAALLKEFGRPTTVAQNYGARNSLIGAELLPYYLQILRINTIIITVLHLIGFVIRSFAESTVVDVLGDSIGTYANSLLIMFAILTIVFALLEKGMIGMKVSDKDWNPLSLQKDWDPFTLPEATPDPEKVRLFDTIVELFFTAAFAMLLVLLPDWAALPEWEGVPDILIKLQPFFPALIGLAVAEIALKLYVLIRGRWNRTTRWIEFGLSAASANMVIALWSVAPFTDIYYIDLTVRISLGITLAIVGGEALLQLYRLLYPNRPLPWEGPLQIK
jgi:hypothetical protein